MLQFEVQEKDNANIIVIGVGGAGCNAVNRMIDVDMKGVTFVGVNTDKQALTSCKAETKIQIGSKLTKGLGAGGNPEVGQKSAEENSEDVAKLVEGAEMVFVTAGMGGGTGTGAAPIIAKVAHDMGILTVGVVTKPFMFEGRKRAAHAELGISFLNKYIDALVVVPNDKLLSLAGEQTSLLEAFNKADEVLQQGVQGITDLISEDGLINLDFADVETVMRNRGAAHMGIGYGYGENKVIDAVKAAIESPLLETSVAGAKAILLNITGGYDISMLDVNQVASQIQSVADDDAIIIFGASLKEHMNDEIMVTVIATGFDGTPRPQYIDEAKASEANDGEIFTTNAYVRTAEVPAEPVVAAEPVAKPAEEKNEIAEEKLEIKEEKVQEEVKEETQPSFVIPSFLQQ
ncbi:MAG: cell division protein FtsZ [Anaerovoracaceae bacterium]